MCSVLKISRKIGLELSSFLLMNNFSKHKYYQVIRKCANNNASADVVTYKYSHPLFTPNGEDPIIRRIIGNALDLRKKRTCDENAIKSEKLKPSLHRNWASLRQTNNESHQGLIIGIEKASNSRPFSYHNVRNEIEMYIDALDVLIKQSTANGTRSILQPLRTWLNVSRKAGKLCKVYLSAANSTRHSSDISEISLLLEDIGQTIEETIDHLICRQHELQYEEFRVSILALGCWLPLYNKSFNVKNSLQTKFNTLKSSLEIGSFDRLFHQRLPADSPIYLNDVSKRLGIAQAWTFALLGDNELEDKYKRYVPSYSFPSIYIKRATNSKMGKYM